MKKYIWVTFRKEGIRHAALDDPNLATGDEYDVDTHRHIFVKVYIEVFMMIEILNPTI